MTTSDFKSKENTIKMPTSKAIITVVSMYNSENSNLKSLALEIAGYVIEAYHDKEELKQDIFGAFVGSKSPSVNRQRLMERQYPKEMEILKSVFGEFLFGGK